MDFGYRSIFAIQLELNSDPGGAWLFGRFCYWIGGKQVGDYEMGTSLRDVFFNLKWIAHDCGNRREARLCLSHPEELFELLDRSLYGVEELAPNVWVPECPARFDVRPPVDVFDGWKVYLVECDMVDLFVYKNTGTGRNVEIYEAPRGTFDMVVQHSYVYLERLLSDTE
jgi:immunity protein 42 of polymorphic toxin system